LDFCLGQEKHRLRQLCLGARQLGLGNGEVLFRCLQVNQCERVAVKQLLRLFHLGLHFGYFSAS